MIYATHLPDCVRPFVIHLRRWLKNWMSGAQSAAPIFIVDPAFTA
jgi:hypothetical protein